MQLLLQLNVRNISLTSAENHHLHAYCKSHVDRKIPPPHRLASRDAKDTAPMCLASALQFSLPCAPTDASDPHHVVTDYLAAMPRRHTEAKQSMRNCQTCVSVLPESSQGSLRVLDSGLSVQITVPVAHMQDAADTNIHRFF